MLREEEADASGRRRPAPRAGGGLGENDGRDAETTAAAQGRWRGGGRRRGGGGGGEEEPAAASIGVTARAGLGLREFWIEIGERFAPGLSYGAYLSRGAG